MGVLPQSLIHILGVPPGVYPLFIALHSNKITGCQLAILLPYLVFVIVIRTQKVMAAKGKLTGYS